MPAKKVKCNLCLKDVYSNAMGAHLLSKAHSADLRTEQNMVAITKKLASVNDGFGKALPPLFVLGKHSYHICLHCDKMYDADTNTSHYVVNHHREHKECLDSLKGDLEKFINGNKSMYTIVSEETDALKKENEDLKKLVKKFREENELQEETIEDMQSDYDKQRKFIKDAFGRCEIDDMIHCLEDKQAGGFGVFDL